MNTPQHPYTPKRALLKCRWQTGGGFENYPIVELAPEEYAAVPGGAVLAKATDAALQSELLGQQDAFPHKILREAKYTTFSGYISCHVMYPFPLGESTLDVITAVWEDDERFRIVRTDAARLLIARALVDYISPTEQRDQLVELIAGIPASPRSDTLM